MTFKSQTELLKGCGEPFTIKGFNTSIDFIPVFTPIPIFGNCDKDGLCHSCQSLLNQTNEIIKMIDEIMSKSYESNERDVIALRHLEDLKQKLQGAKE